MKSNLKNISVLIPDGESTLLYNVVYSFSLIRHVRIYVMSSHRQIFFKYSKRNNCLKSSRYVKKFLFYPETTDENWINHINQTVEDFNIDIIMPIFDDGAERIIRNAEYLKHKAKLCPLPNLSNFLTARHKDRLYTHLESHDLPAPKSFVSDHLHKPNSIDLDFPIIAKPVVGFEGGQGVKLLENERAIDDYMKVYGDSKILFQEYIRGYDMSCNVLCSEGEVLAYTMQKAATSEEGKVTPQFEFSFVNEKSLLLTLKKLMKSLEWSGVANIDFRYDYKDRQFKVIEINTKFWLNTEASALAGVNFPYLYCLLSLGKKIEFREAKEMTFLHLNALIKRLKKTPVFIFKTGYLKHNTPLLFAIKDPLVLVCKFFWRTNNIISLRRQKRKALL
ncbi:ATP-grasp domain-containing protein [Winogradskyella sp.]|uniref:ATP-grasp domain-containing protein n=1 Tax=Winogradskyella sp. TaxID=1883156 RepID=UPI003BACD9FF